MSRTYQVDKVFRVRNELRAVLRHHHAGHTRRGRGFELMAVHAYDKLAEHGVEEFAPVMESLRHLAGRPLTAELLDETAWRLAGNLPTLAGGEPVPPWRPPRYKEWVPVQVLSEEPFAGRGRLRHTLSCRVLAGSPCALKASVSWTGRTCAYMARHFGFTRPAKDGSNPRPYLAPAQFVTMRFEALIDPEKGREGPGFHEVRFDQAALRAWNAEQHRLRARALPGYECPHGQPRTQWCHLCPYGWEDCPAGTHRFTYEPRPCAGCGEAEAPFDPGDTGEECVNCLRGRLTRR